MRISCTRRIVHNGALEEIPPTVMKFTLEPAAGSNFIRGYAAGEIRVGEQLIRSSCIVTADALITDWRPANLDELTCAALEPIFQLRPELVLLGTGIRQRFPPIQIRAAFTTRGIGLEVMDLGAACRTFNILVQEERRVAAALLLAGPSSGELPNDRG